MQLEINYFPLTACDYECVKLYIFIAMNAGVGVGGESAKNDLRQELNLIERNNHRIERRMIDDAPPLLSKNITLDREIITFLAVINKG